MGHGTETNQVMACHVIFTAWKNSEQKGFFQVKGRTRKLPGREDSCSLEHWLGGHERLSFMLLGIPSLPLTPVLIRF